MAPVLRFVAQVTRGGRWVVSRRNFSSYRKRYESKGPGVQSHLLRVTGTSMGCYLGCVIHGDWVSEIEEKRQKVVRKSIGLSGEIEDLRAKMWSDFKLGRIFSDIKKILSG